jgi:sugar phosphate isomerase/epimerase
MTFALPCVRIYDKRFSYTLIGLTMQLGIHENILPGSTLAEKFMTAKSLGLTGVEVRFDEPFDQKMPEVAAAMETTGVQVTALDAGMTRLLHPEFEERQRTLAYLQQAIGCSIDLMSSGVVFRPFYQSGPTLPDLTPYKSAQELEFELLAAQLRTSLVDLADALGTTLYVAPVNHSETDLIRKVAHGAMLRHSYNDHPRLKVAAHTYHMMVEGEDLASTLREHAADVGYLYLSVPDGSLSLTVSPESQSVMGVLHEINYTGWVILDTVSRTPQTREAIQLSVDQLQGLLQ